MPTFPVLLHTALDATDCRGLAEFYREFLGLRYRHPFCILASAG